MEFFLQNYCVCFKLEILKNNHICVLGSWKYLITLQSIIRNRKNGRIKERTQWNLRKSKPYC